MKSLNIELPEILMRMLKAEAAAKGFYFKDYVKKILEERKR